MGLVMGTKRCGGIGEEVLAKENENNVDKRKMTKRDSRGQ